MAGTFEELRPRKDMKKEIKLSLADEAAYRQKAVQRAPALLAMYTNLREVRVLHNPVDGPRCQALETALDRAERARDITSVDAAAVRSADAIIEAVNPDIAEGIAKLQVAYHAGRPGSDEPGSGEPGDRETEDTALPREYPEKSGRIVIALHVKSEARVLEVTRTEGAQKALARAGIAGEGTRGLVITAQEPDERVSAAAKRARVQVSQMILAE